MPVCTFTARRSFSCALTAVEDGRHETGPDADEVIVPPMYHESFKQTLPLTCSPKDSSHSICNFFIIFVFFCWIILAVYSNLTER